MWQFKLKNFTAKPKISVIENSSKYLEYYSVIYDEKEIIKFYETNCSTNSMILLSLLKQMEELLEKYDLTTENNSIVFNLKKKYVFFNSNDDEKSIVIKDDYIRIKEEEERKNRR